MDYERVYRDFIADRRARPPGEDEYVERHHILPRCMGGGDDPDNLIRLHPEDHFFAHVLLARIHDTHEMLAMVVMYLNRKAGLYRRGKPARTSYGWARRRLAVRLSEAMQGEKHPLHDKTVFTWHHADAGRFTGTRVALALHAGQDSTNITGIISGRIKSCGGWYLEGTDVGTIGKWPRGARHASYDPTIYEFHHVDGRVILGTRYEFSDQTGITWARVRELTKQRRISTDGWHIPAHGRRVVSVMTASGAKIGVERPFGRQNALTFDFVHEDGREFAGTKFDLATKHGLSVRGLHLVAIGKRMSFSGWRLKSTSADLIGPKRGKRHHAYNNEVHRFIGPDGKTERCTQHELCERYGLDVRNISTVLKGRRKSAYGWKLVPRPVKAVQLSFRFAA
jgi:hypothetical protein